MSKRVRDEEVTNIMLDAVNVDIFARIHFRRSGYKKMIT